MKNVTGILLTSLWLCSNTAAQVKLDPDLMSTVSKHAERNRIENQAKFSNQADSTDWNQWRGAGRDGRVRAEWPDSLNDQNLRLEWVREFSPSYSGPVVSGGLVFTTETRNRATEHVHALDLNTGKTAWETSWPGAMTVPFFAARNGSWIRATPATDGKRLYVVGMLGKLVCLDAQNGKQIWVVDLNQRYGVTREAFGHVSSPLLLGDPNDAALYVQCAAGFVKLDRQTGKEIWRNPIGSGDMMSGGAFSSPILATLVKQRQLVIQTRLELAGIAIDSGKTLWKQAVPAFRGMNILTPIVDGDLVFTSAYNNESHAFKVQRKHQGFKVQEKWSSKQRGYMSTPVLVNGHVYLLLQNRQLACFELESGQIKWETRERKRFGPYMSMISNGDSILALDSGGSLVLLAADPNEFRLLGKVKLATDDSWAHLAIDGNRILVRGLRSLAAFRWN